MNNLTLGGRHGWIVGGYLVVVGHFVVTVVGGRVSVRQGGRLL
jgi:hypothetical protein